MPLSRLEVLWALIGGFSRASCGPLGTFLGAIEEDPSMIETSPMYEFISVTFFVDNMVGFGRTRT